LARAIFLGEVSEGAAEAPSDPPNEQVTVEVL
jgi:hypothetical protein